MRIQSQTPYLATYTKLRNTENKNAFPYSVKVKGVGSSSSSVMFDFAAVELTEHLVTEKYGTEITNNPIKYKNTAGSKAVSEWVEPSKDEVDNIELPLSYDKLKDSYSFYYHGNSISDYELVQTAVASGKLQLPEAGETADPQIAYKAFKALVMDEAAPKYPWSDTLYSEDGKYTFTRDSRGNLKFNLIEDEDMGVAVEDIANWIMSGTPNRNIETRYINYLRKIDPDLLEKAQTIGEEVRTNGFLEDLHEQGIISDKQSIYDMGLLGMLFGKNSDDMKLSLNNCKKSNDYLSLLVDFNKEGANSLKNLRLKQLKESNGGIY